MTFDIEKITALFEEMLADLKTDYVTSFTDGDGVVHPAMMRRWERYEAGYRDSFKACFTEESVITTGAWMVAGVGAAATISGCLLQAHTWPFGSLMSPHRPVTLPGPSGRRKTPHRGCPGGPEAWPRGSTGPRS